MATDTLTDTGTGTIDWIPGTGYFPPVIQDESQNRLTPECFDAVLAEWNPRAAEQLAGIESQEVSRVPPLRDNYHNTLGFIQFPSVHGYDCRLGQR